MSELWKFCSSCKLPSLLPFLPPSLSVANQMKLCEGRVFSLLSSLYPSNWCMGSTQLPSYSKLVISGQNSTQARTGPSIATPNLSRAAQKPLSSSDRIGCNHQCLGCKPRLKYPHITNRNFIKLLSTDKFTCTYHSRLVRWVHNCRGNSPLSSTKLRGQEEGGIGGKDASETSHGSYWGVN